MSSQPIAVLIEVDEFSDSLAVVNVFRVNRPVAPYIVGWPFCGGWCSEKCCSP